MSDIPTPDSRLPTPDPPIPTRTVVLVPPLLVPADPLFWPMAWSLKRAGYNVRIFRYPSYRRDIPQNAENLAAFLRGLNVEEVDAVTYSLGSIVLRWAATHCDMPRLRRVVFLGPPHRGAYLADWLHERLGPIFPLIYGRCALQLRRGDRGLCERAGIPPAPAEFAIVAGGKGSTRGFNPIIPGDNDFTVGVEETVLPGMKDFALVPVRHTFLPIRKRTRELVARFLETGRFRERAASH